MKASEFRNKSESDLQKELLASLKEQFNLRIQKGSGQDIQHHLLKKVRRKIACLKTILSEKEGSSS